jgi:quercetin dioxygenase-like cupin family protein
LQTRFGKAAKATPEISRNGARRLADVPAENCPLENFRVESRTPTMANTKGRQMNGTDILAQPVHLGLGARAFVEPHFAGSMDWYDAYAKRHHEDGLEGRLVSMHAFAKSWDMWEMHPHGSEVVICTAGSLTLYQEHVDGTIESVFLVPGQYAINDAGTWHTADVEGQATALFITAGWGTQHRPR